MPVGCWRMQGPAAELGGPELCPVRLPAEGSASREVRAVCPRLHPLRSRNPARLGDAQPYGKPAALLGWFWKNITDRQSCFKTATI